MGLAIGEEKRRVLGVLNLSWVREESERDGDVVVGRK